MYPFTDTIWNVEVLSATVGRIETYSKVVVMNNQRGSFSSSVHQIRPDQWSEQGECGPV